MLSITLDQNPLANGLKIGETFRREIKELTAIRRHLIKGFLKDFSPEKIENLALSHVEILKNYPDFHAEFSGICQAADITPADLVILNNYTDMRDFSTHGQDEGCTVYSFKDLESQPGQARVFAGQTWDMHASARPFMLHMHLKNQGAPDAHVLSLTGCFGLSGLNSHGVGVLINNLHCKETQAGLMWCALVRGMLQQESAGDAYVYLQKNMPSSGHNYLLCDAKESFNIETSGRRHDLTHRISAKESGSIVHSNHYVGALKEIEMDWRRSSTTVARLEKAEAFFEATPAQQIRYEGLAQELLGVGDYCVNVEPEAGKPHGSATCGGIHMDLTEPSGMMFAGQYAEQDQIRMAF